MAICKCGSQAINDGAHGRILGERLDLCDVCYWREKAVVAQVACADQCESVSHRYISAGRHCCANAADECKDAIRKIPERVVVAAAKTKNHVRHPEQAVAYLVDCTLATVTDLAMKKSRPKAGFSRQISIAQTGIDWMVGMSIDPTNTRAGEIIKAKITVAQWAEQYMPEKAAVSKKG